MIENLRKYTGLIIVLFILVLIGFLFMDTSAMRKSPAGGAPYIKVAGRTYSDKEFNQLGASAYQVTQSLAQSGDFQLYSFLFGLSGEAEFGSRQSMDSFFASRMLLRAAKKEFGIYPGEEEIDSFIRKLRAFTGPNGEFSVEQYRNFIEKYIGRFGLTEGDIRDLASDVLAQEKLTEILGAGLNADRASVTKNSALESQRIALDVVRIDLDPIEAKIEPTEEQIKTYWQTTRDAFKTSEKRKFTYLIAKPAILAEPAEDKPLREPTAPIEPTAPAALAADATEEVKSTYEQEKKKYVEAKAKYDVEKAKYDADKAAREAKIAEARRKAQLETGALADDFLFQLEEQKELTFEKLAEKNKWELKTTDLFALADAPKDLKAALRSTSTPGTAADELFKMTITSDPLSKISPAIAIGEDEWLIARLDETEEVQAQTYEEARAEARARFIAEEATKALKSATEEAAAKIKTEIAAGKSFADAAKEAGITVETVSLTDVTTGYQGDTTKVPSTLFNNARYTDPGALTEPVFESDRAFIIHVSKREIVKQENAEQMLQAGLERAQDGIRITAFNAWLDAKKESSGIETLYNQ